MGKKRRRKKKVATKSHRSVKEKVYRNGVANKIEPENVLFVCLLDDGGIRTSRITLRLPRLNLFR
jgi:hypothetical protein